MRMRESEIIEKIIQKDEKGLSVLYDMYSDAIYGIILRITKDPGLAEEVLQETMLKAWSKMSLFKSAKSSLYTWLATIGRNTSIDKVRLQSYANLNKTDSFEVNIHDGSSTDLELSSLDTDKLIGKLDDKYKQIIIKIYLQGYSQRDLAKELNIPLGTVKTRLKKGIELLREEIKSDKAILAGLISIMVLIYLLCL